MDKGVVVDVGNDIEGFVPQSQLGIPESQDIAQVVKEGQAVDLKVLEVDPIHHRIVLAATGFPPEEPGAVREAPPAAAAEAVAAEPVGDEPADEEPYAEEPPAGP